jgi:hypothetical protein
VSSASKFPELTILKQVGDRPSRLQLAGRPSRTCRLATKFQSSQIDNDYEGLNDFRPPKQADVWPFPPGGAELQPGRMEFIDHRRDLARRPTAITWTLRTCGASDRISLAGPTVAIDAWSRSVI